MSKFYYKILQYFYGTWLGGKYMEFLLWLDKQNSNTRVITPTETNQIVMQAQQILYKEGIGKIKRHINSIITSKNKDEYDKALKQFENLIPLAERENDNYAELKKSLLKTYIHSEKDIKTATDHAKMIEGRIKNYMDLREDIAKRKLLREIRKEKTKGNKEAVEKLTKEFMEKYGKRR